MTRPGPALLLTDAGEMALTGTEPASESVPTMWRAVGAMLRRTRERRGLLQREAAERAGISAGVLSRLERSERQASLVTVLRVCNALGVRFSDVMRAAEDEAFPLGGTPWTGFPVALTGYGIPPRDAGVTAMRGGDV